MKRSIPLQRIKRAHVLDHVCFNCDDDIAASIGGDSFSSSLKVAHRLGTTDPILGVLLRNLCVVHQQLLMHDLEEQVRQEKKS